MYRRLFRSLEVAFHAGLFPGDGLTSINDIGTRLGLWVSAFEILFHPGGKSRVNKLDVERAFEAAPFGLTDLTARRYPVSYSGKMHRVTLCGAICDDLYEARNDLMHGNRVSPATLHYRRSRRYIQMIDLAPIVFNAALLAFLEDKIPGAPEAVARADDLEEYFRRREGISDVQHALSAARYPVDEYGHLHRPEYNAPAVSPTPTIAP